VNPLSALYAAVMQARNRLYDRRSITIHRLRGPVVSIGNIAAGGSGKTPFLIMLGELLNERGIPFDVLSRGYGRATRGVVLVDPAGSPQDYGDEPLLIARKLQVPVVVGEDRYAAGQFAEQKFGPQLHLLDDGFQHRRLARDFDIVMVTPTDAKDSLLPVGRLREPLSSLARADAVVLTNDTSNEELPLPTQRVWRVRRSIVPPDTKGSCFAFCGIARPRIFFDQLQAAGVGLAGTRSFRDHHFYSEIDVRGLLELRKQSSATAFVTTEKDAINLGSHLGALQPMYIVPVAMRLENSGAAVDALVTTIRERNPQPA
jgi:tetraacyldisaccharide 4'-kinase